MRLAVTLLLLVCVFFSAPVQRSHSQTAPSDLQEQARRALAQTAGTLRLRDAWGSACIYAWTPAALFSRRASAPRRIGSGKWICGGAWASWPKSWGQASSVAKLLPAIAAALATIKRGDFSEIPP